MLCESGIFTNVVNFLTWCECFLIGYFSVCLSLGPLSGVFLSWSCTCCNKCIISILFVWLTSARVKTGFVLNWTKKWKNKKKLLYNRQKLTKQSKRKFQRKFFFQNLSFKFLKLTVVIHLASLRPHDQYKSMAALFVILRQPLMWST